MVYAWEGTTPDRYACDVAALQQVEVLADLSGADLCRLASVARRQQHRRGDMIACDEETERICIVVAGAVRRYLVSGDGRRELTLSHWKAGEVFELSGLDRTGTLEALAVAVQDATIVYIVPWAAVLEVLALQSGATLSFIDLFRQDRREEVRLINQLAFCTARERLARELLHLAEQEGCRTFRRTRPQLAADVGSRAEEVAKLLSRFKAEGLVTYPPHGRRITVSDPEGLRACVDPFATARAEGCVETPVNTAGMRPMDHDHC